MRARQARTAGASIVAVACDLALYGVVLAVFAVCGSAGSTGLPSTRLIAGVYTGTLQAGQLQWTLAQDGQRITGSGSFTKATDSTKSTHAIRGTMSYDILSVRLVGAPGDSDADSVVFRGTYVDQLYSGGAFTGTVVGPSTLLFGELSIYRR